MLLDFFLFIKVKPRVSNLSGNMFKLSKKVKLFIDINNIEPFFNIIFKLTIRGLPKEESKA